MPSIGIIPARYASSRFPAKPLIDIKGKPMIQRVYEQAKKASSLDKVVVATDDERILETVATFGGEAIMTSSHHQSGTDRCLEAVEKVEGEFDVIVNIQGDEPFISPAQIDLILSCFEDNEVGIATLIKKIDQADDLWNAHKPKVVFDQSNFALLFSRQCIPFLRDIPKEDWPESHSFYRHIGMYAYTHQSLQEICQLKQSKLELAEGLEQLRWLENGYRIKTAITEEETYGIDTPEDLTELLKKDFLFKG